MNPDIVAAVKLCRSHDDSRPDVTVCLRWCYRAGLLSADEYTRFETYWRELDFPERIAQALRMSSSS